MTNINRYKEKKKFTILFNHSNQILENVMKKIIKCDQMASLRTESNY